MRKSILVALVALFAISASAQQVTTLYFLENAPMRHTINPAFQPVSQGYVNFTPLGWMTIGVGNNSVTMSDVLYVDPETGQTITPLHPHGDKQAFLNTLRGMTFINGEATLGLLNIGFRLKEKGYLTIGINERINAGATLPKPLFNFLVGGGMTNMAPGAVNSFNLSGIGAGGSGYTEIGVGYSHKINDQWTVGGKFKFLLGSADAAARSRNLGIDASTDQWHIKGDFAIEIAGPLNFDAMPDMDNRRLIDVIHDFTDGGSSSKPFYVDSLIDLNNIPGLLKPSGYGAAIDLGFTWKPLEQLQISAAINDLGFIYWNNSRKYTASLDTIYDGVGVIDYNDPAYQDADGNFSPNLVLDSALSTLKGLANAIILHPAGSGYAKMISARLNVGLDANFWDNRVGVGIVSATRLYDARLYEEVTIGVSFRPVNWFNIAATYSLMNNGKYSNIGAGLSFMPYDGINMTLAMDYIPTSYAAIDINNTPRYLIPDKAKMVNLALGFSICWGTNRKDKDKDGVWDKIDMCPNTPRGVVVDEKGCPLDEDLDGVPDYRDHCLATPAAARLYVDSVGCPADSDGDGVEDYRDNCPNTPAMAWGKVDNFGCPLDSDGDGVADYLDECPDTEPAAYGRVDNVGCPKDSDKDGVPDYLDLCPNTPAGAAVDENGCPADSDKDGVPDYLDECPNSQVGALGHVDEKGCEIDTDGDGVPDYLDQCPQVPGVKANNGCPQMQREVRQLLQKAMQGIEFETGKATIKAKSYPLLNQVATTFIENSHYIIEVQGYTDNTGKAEANKQLSQKRAQAVMDYLVKKGVSASRLSAVGYGPENPIADNKTAAGRAKNRRVEFKITFEEVRFEPIGE